jgi:hypothetical protein
MTGHMGVLSILCVGFCSIEFKICCLVSLVVWYICNMFTSSILSFLIHADSSGLISSQGSLQKNKSTSPFQHCY